MSSTFIPVDDFDDPRLAEFQLKERGLANRNQRRDDAGAGLFLAEGDLVVQRAFDAGCVPVAALADGARVPQVAERLNTPVYVGGDEVRRRVTGLGLPHSIIALFERPARSGVAELAATANKIVVVEGVDNPANIGSIVRNAAAMGWDAMILDHTSADPLSRRSLRVAMGTAFQLPHARSSDLVGDLARLADIVLYALTPDADATDISDVRPAGRRAVLIGSERAGLSDELMALAERVRIPMADGVDSLNAAAATAIACYALG